MLFQEYRESRGLNFSHLKRIAKSPLDFKENVQLSTRPLGLGQHIHTAGLEPAEFAKRFIPFAGDRRTKAYKEFKAAHEGMTILSASDWDTCTGIADSIHRHPVAAGYLSKGKAEQTIFWEHELGFQCKSRLDWLSDDLVLDLKSAVDITHDGFARACVKYSYHAQLAWYASAAKSVDGKDRKCVLLAVEKTPPFDVAPYVLPAEAIEAGRKLYTDWLLMVRKCQSSGTWPGVAPTETELHLPAWAFGDAPETKLMIGGVEVAV